MRVGILRRVGSFIVDAMPIFVILSLLFQFFVGELLKQDNYDVMYAEYEELRVTYFGDLEQQYLDDELTLEEYQVEFDEINPQFQAATEDHYAVLFEYMIRVIMYNVLGFILIYYLYSVFMKGRTLGRRLLKIELGGNINAWTLFMREVLWKLGYWVVTFLIGGIILDILFISFSKKRQTLRDIVTRTYVKYEGVDYPF